ncbi:hypothetical protein ACIBG7_15300 [Nonomuraea sp. NPDC050328]|uniref:hypothetical protein n=1 Tax=Nonomuraea sp. NPDC050328 TaxID=3364361 RepID=UPI003795E0A8
MIGKKTIAASAGAAVLLLGAGAASAAWKEPAGSYGGCVAKSTGQLRVLERDNLAKSVDGACNSRERKLTFYSRAGVDKLVKPLKGFELTFDGVTAVCKPGGTGTSGLPKFACVKATPTPAPSSSPTSP